MSLGGCNPLIMTIDIKAPSVAGERCRVTARSVANNRFGETEESSLADYVSGDLLIWFTSIWSFYFHLLCSKYT